MFVPKDLPNQGVFTKTLFDLPCSTGTGTGAAAGGITFRPSAFITSWQNVQTADLHNTEDPAGKDHINFQTWLLLDGTILMGYEGLSQDSALLPATAAVVPGFEDQVSGHAGQLSACSACIAPV